MQMIMKIRTKFAKLIWEKGLKMQNISTTGTKSDKNPNFINYFGLEMKTVFDLRDQMWQFLKLDFDQIGTKQVQGPNLTIEKLYYN